MYIIKQMHISKEDIIKNISSFDIFKKYCKNFKEIGKHFKSDLREDKNPSCIIDWIKGDLMYSDFGYNLHLRAIDYVSLKYSISFKDTLKKITNDFNIDTYEIKTNNPIITKENKEYNKDISTIIKIKKRCDEKNNPIYRNYDLKYWEEYYWTEDMLRKSNTWAISHFMIMNKRINSTYYIGNERVFSYDYYWNDNIFRRKIYFPDRKNNKWISNVNNTIVQLVDVAPKKGNILFITSSKKDAGIFWRMQIEKCIPDIIIHGVAPNNEASFVPEKWFEKMKKRWDKIIIWYNNDETGIMNSKKFSEKYKINYYYNPIGTPKDPSDFCKKHSIKEFINLVKKSIYE